MLQKHDNIFNPIELQGLSRLIQKDTPISNMSYLRNGQWERRSDDRNMKQKLKPSFDLNSLESCRYLKNYNAMKDKYCSNYFDNGQIKSHLNRVGLIAKGGILVERQGEYDRNQQLVLDEIVYTENNVNNPNININININSIQSGFRRMISI